MKYLAETLTYATGNRLDFFNIGGLAIQRTKESFWGLWNHYSWRELLVRGGIISTTIIMGYLAANSCNDDQCSSYVRGIVGGTVGFFVSHAAAVIPTIQRRNNLIRDTQHYKTQIEESLNQLSPNLLQHAQIEQLQQIRTQLQEMVNYINNLQLPVAKKGDAIKNLITQKTMMKNLLNYVQYLNTNLCLQNQNQVDRKEKPEEFINRTIRLVSLDKNAFFEKLKNNDYSIENEPQNISMIF